MAQNRAPPPRPPPHTHHTTPHHTMVIAIFKPEVGEKSAASTLQGDRRRGRAGEGEQGQEGGAGERGKLTKRPCSSNARTSLSCCPNPRYCERWVASPSARGGGRQMRPEAQEQGARLVGASRPRFQREVSSSQAQLSSSREETDKVDTPTHAKASTRRTQASA